MFKSAKQPHCLWCHRPIAKHTTWHNPVTPAQWQQSFKQGFETAAKTMADCQKLSNEKVVSVKYQYETDDNYDQTGRRVVHSYSTWDGESYKDQFFCNGDHAKAYAYAAAHHGLRFKKNVGAA
jgi:hypothetical protein